jgi:hypothetical protein
VILVAGKTKEHSRFQIPDSTFQIPDSRFQIPDSTFQIPHSRFQRNSKFRNLVLILKGICHLQTLEQGMAELDSFVWNLEF